MLTSEAAAATEHASKYIVQLAKHWSHRYPELTYSPTRADIPLPSGPCILEAAGDRLSIRLTAPDAEALARMQAVVVEHVNRFAHRAPLSFEWSAPV